MFRLQLDCINPFHKEDEDFESTDFVYWENKITTNKAIDFQISKFQAYHLFEFDLSIRFDGEDHAGPYLMMSFMGFFFNLKLYDIRHWDYDNDRWQQ